MLCVVICDQQELTKYAFKNLLLEIGNEEMKFNEVESIYDLKSVLTKCDQSLLLINPRSYNLEQQIDQILDLQNQYTNSSWVVLFDEINEAWLRKILQFKQIKFSVIFKNDSLESVRKGLEVIVNGGIYLTEAVQKILEEHQNSINKVDNILTNAEREILKEVASGKMTKEIAADRNISIHTVITHRKNIFKKLEVNNVHDATRYAIRAGIITVNDYYI